MHLESVSLLLVMIFFFFCSSADVSTFIGHTLKESIAVKVGCRERKFL